MIKTKFVNTLDINFGINKFDRCWGELNKKCLKYVQYYNTYAWAVNPAIATKSYELPYWLYFEFQDSLNPFLSANTISRLQEKVKDFKHKEKNKNPFYI